MRGLALVLLVLVGYAAIAGAAHSHGNVPAPLVRESTGTSISESDRDGSSSKKLVNNGDCLVCQLHRNLLEALTAPELAATPTTANLSHKHATAVFNSLETEISQHGRAPPITA